MADVVYTKIDNLRNPIDYCQVLLRRKTRKPEADNSPEHKVYDYAVGMVVQVAANRYNFRGADDDGQPVLIRRQNLPMEWQDFIYIGGMGDQA